MLFRYRLRLFALAALCFLPLALASGQSYTSIVIIGDSLSDTGNDTYVSATTPTAGVPVPAPITGYTTGRFTDGADSTPSAIKYYGVWIEQLAAMLAAKPAVVNSLTPGGTNYAYGFATTGSGTTPFTYGPNNVLSFPVNNMGLQLSTYLATNPTITNQTLFVVWGGANDLINATSSTDIQNAAAREAGIVQSLINAGATDFIVPNLPPLGAVPRFNGSVTTSAPATAAASGFNQYLAAYIAGIPAANPGKTLHLYSLDVYTLFNTILAAPSNYGFANVTAISQGTAVNPDTYLFWDSLHPTTYGHSLIASSAMALLGAPVVTTTTLASNNSNANLGASVTFKASVMGTTGTPVGTVTFLDGSTVIGTSYVTGTTTTGTAALTTSSLSAGTHNISASFTGVNGYGSSSTVAAISEIVTAPAVSSGFSPSSITLTRGSGGSATLVITPVGGYSGVATISCGPGLPTGLYCNPSPSTVGVGNNAQARVTFYLDTTGATTSVQPLSFGHTGVVIAFALLPCFGLFGVTAKRRRRLGKSITLPLVLMFVSALAVLGAAGCGSGGVNSIPAGTYTINATTTINGATMSDPLSVTVQ